VLAAASEQPDALVIGIDADAGSMIEASRRAARPLKRGGLPNARFVVAAAAALPSEFDGCADAMTVHFPWGSLLRGLLAAEPGILAGIARVLRPAGVLTLLLSVTEHDRSIGPSVLDEGTFAALAPRYAVHGLRLSEARPAAPDDVARAHSTWAKRLGAGASRPAWLARFERANELITGA
jgi:16S rRNA (adenine(1408)-N(1))-methyltransferase